MGYGSDKHLFFTYLCLFSNISAVELREQEFGITAGG